MLSSYENILVAVDGSKGSNAAFHKSLHIAKRNNSTLHIVNVIDTSMVTTIPGYEDSLLKEYTKFAEDLLQAHKTIAESFGVININLILEYGSPKAIIPKAIVEKVNADLIVCGANGLNALERFLVGSVSKHIVQSAICDVLVVRPDKNKEYNNEQIL